MSFPSRLAGYPWCELMRHGSKPVVDPKEPKKSQSFLPDYLGLCATRASDRNRAIHFGLVLHIFHSYFACQCSGIIDPKGERRMV